MQRNRKIIRNRPITPGTDPISPGDGCTVFCSSDGWVRLILQNGSFYEAYCLTGGNDFPDMHVRGCAATPLYTPAAGSVVVNVFDVQQ